MPNLLILQRLTAWAEEKVVAKNLYIRSAIVQLLSRYNQRVSLAVMRGAAACPAINRIAPLLFGVVMILGSVGPPRNL